MRVKNCNKSPSSSSWMVSSDSQVCCQNFQNAIRPASLLSEIRRSMAAFIEFICNHFENSKARFSVNKKSSSKGYKEFSFLVPRDSDCAKVPNFAYFNEIKKGADLVWNQTCWVWSCGPNHQLFLIQYKRKEDTQWRASRYKHIFLYYFLQVLWQATKETNDQTCFTIVVYVLNSLILSEETINWNSKGTS